MTGSALYCHGQQSVCLHGDSGGDNAYGTTGLIEEFGSTANADLTLSDFSDHINSKLGARVMMIILTNPLNGDLTYSKG